MSVSSMNLLSSCDNLPRVTLSHDENILDLERHIFYSRAFI